MIACGIKYHLAPHQLLWMMSKKDVRTIQEEHQLWLFTMVDLGSIHSTRQSNNILLSQKKIAKLCILLYFYDLFLYILNRAHMWFRYSNLWVPSNVSHDVEDNVIWTTLGLFSVDYHLDLGIAKTYYREHHSFTRISQVVSMYTKNSYLT